MHFEKREPNPCRLQKTLPLKYLRKVLVRKYPWLVGRIQHYKTGWPCSESCSSCSSHRSVDSWALSDCESKSRHGCTGCWVVVLGDYSLLDAKPMLATQQQIAIRICRKITLTGIIWLNPHLKQQWCESFLLWWKQLLWKTCARARSRSGVQPQPPHCDCTYIKKTSCDIPGLTQQSHALSIPRCW